MLILFIDVPPGIFLLLQNYPAVCIYGVGMSSSNIFLLFEKDVRNGFCRTTHDTHLAMVSSYTFLVF